MYPEGDWRRLIVDSGLLDQVLEMAAVFEHGEKDQQAKEGQENQDQAAYRAVREGST
jgi:hypothetical protein